MQDLATLVRAHEDIYRSFTELVRDLDDADWHRPTGCPGWDVADQVAHVASLEALLAGDPFPDDHALTGDTAHVRDDVGRFMEVLVDVRRRRSREEVVAELEGAVARRRSQLAAHTDVAEEWPSFRGGTQPLYRSLPIRVVDLYAHEQDVRRAVGRSGHTSGPAPAIVVERFAKGLAAVLPTKLDRPGVVRFELTDDPARSFQVALGGADPDTDPTVRIPVTVEQFVAIGAGRADAPRATALDLEGDGALAAMVLPVCGLTP